MSRRWSARASATMLGAVIAALAWGAPAASGATTVFKGRFVCQDRGEELPLAGARVELLGTPQDKYVLFFGDQSFITRPVAVSHTGPDGEWSFEVHRRQGSETRYNFYAQVALDDNAGTAVGHWPDNGTVTYPTDTNQNDVAVQDYRTLALPGPGNACAVWLALRRAREDYAAVTSRPPPFGGVRVAYGDVPSRGRPYTAYDTIFWPGGYPPGPGPGSQVTAIHEFAHLVRNSSLGSRARFFDEVGQFDYRQRSRSPCTRTTPRAAFHEGWAEFWAGDFFPAPCPATQADPSVEGDVAWSLTGLERSCRPRRRLVEVLLAHGPSIHSFDDFRRALGSCVTRPLDPGTVPHSPISSPIRAGTWVTNVRRTLRGARGAAARLGEQLTSARRAARHASCPRLPCRGALARRLAPAIIAGRLAQARLLASTLAAQISPRSRRLQARRPTRAVLDRLLAGPRVLTRGLARIGARSLDRALAAGRPITRRDHSAATAALLRTLRAARTAFARARRRGRGLPLAFRIVGGRMPPLSRVPTNRLVSFDGIPAGTLLTTQTAPAGATFGPAAALGFPGGQPRHTCPDGPTAAGGTAVAPDCASSTPGFRDTGLVARLTESARSVTVRIGATRAQPGGFAADLDGYDASGHRVAGNAVLVGSSSNGQGAGPVQALSIRSVGSAAPIAYVVLSFDGSFSSGSRLVFDDLAYAAP